MRRQQIGARRAGRAASGACFTGATKPPHRRERPRPPRHASMSMTDLDGRDSCRRASPGSPAIACRVTSETSSGDEPARLPPGGSRRRRRPPPRAPGRQAGRRRRGLGLVRRGDRHNQCSARAPRERRCAWISSSSSFQQGHRRGPSSAAADQQLNTRGTFNPSEHLDVAAPDHGLDALRRVHSIRPDVVEEPALRVRSRRPPERTGPLSRRRRPQLSADSRAKRHAAASDASLAAA